MRKYILAAAMVSVAVPAFAQNEDAWAARRAERQQQREQRQAGEPNQEAHQQRFEQRQQQQEVQQQRVEQRQQQQEVRQQRVEQTRGASPGDWQRNEQPRAVWSRPAPQSAPVVVQSDTPPTRRYEGRQWQGQRTAPQQDTTVWRQGSGDRGMSGEWQQRQQSGQWQQRNSQYQPNSQWQQKQPNSQWQQQSHDGQHWAGQSGTRQRWSNQWRNDQRYDWQRYRARNQSIFRLGNYYDPFGYGYRRVNIGFTLYSGYYSPDYWLDDPWQYRLPPVYGPYRWVRYYDDAVLVDIYTGQVRDVIRNFFW